MSMATVGGRLVGPFPASVFHPSPTSPDPKGGPGGLPRPAGAQWCSVGGLGVLAWALDVGLILGLCWWFEVGLKWPLTASFTRHSPTALECSRIPQAAQAASPGHPGPRGFWQVAPGLNSRGFVCFLLLFFTYVKFAVTSLPVSQQSPAAFAACLIFIPRFAPLAANRRYQNAQ